MRRLLGTGAAIALAAIAAPAAQAGPVTPVPGLPADALTVMNQAPYASGSGRLGPRPRHRGLGRRAEGERAGGARLGGQDVQHRGGVAGIRPGQPRGDAGEAHRDVAGGTLNGNLILVGKGDITMGGRTKPDGTVDFTNLDHNDANCIPGATLTHRGPADRAERAGRAGARRSGIDACPGT